MDEPDLRTTVLWLATVAAAKGFSGVIIYRSLGEWHDVSVDEIEDPEEYLMQLKQNGAYPVVLVNLTSEIDKEVQINTQLS